MEIRNIEGTEGRYGVTSDGRVWSYVTNKFLKPGKAGQGGYYSVALRVSGKYRTTYVHRAVATAFIANPDNKPVVNHKNGVKTDNRVDNLEWATVKENVSHAIATGLTNQVGENNAYSKLTEAKVEQIRVKYLNDPEASQATLAAEYGVHRVLVKKIVTGVIWRHTWKPEYDRPAGWKKAGFYAAQVKYSDNLIAEIQAKHSLGGYTTRSIGMEYGISHGQISQMLRKKLDRLEF